MKSLYVYSLLLLMFIGTANAQEFRAQVVVDASSLNTANLSIFKTLEKSLTSFINDKHWTQRVFRKKERIKANIYLVVKKYDNNRFTCELNVSALRPVYASTYETPLFLVSDKNFSFEYQEFQPLVFNPDQIEDNLTATIAYYLYMILGYDFDSFKLNAGKPYFEQAQNIAESAQSAGLPGWEKTGDFFSKPKWVEQLLTSSNFMFHKAFYTYHRYGLDLMAQNPKQGKTNIIRAIQYLTKLNAHDADFIIKLFFDTKSDEIVNILKEGPKTVNYRNVKTFLDKLAPTYAPKWKKLP